MRLIVTETGQFVEINDPAKHVYAILSHTWDPEGEQSYREVRETQCSVGMEILPESALDANFYADTVPTSAFPFEPRDVDFIPATSLDAAAQLFMLQFKIQCAQLGLDVEAVTRPPVSLSAASIESSSQLPSRSILVHPSIAPKIKRACAIARQYGYRLLWIDSCCIEKESSAELSEAINSMFNWYHRASVCFAFTPDFPSDLLERPLIKVGVIKTFRARCRWFRRGWTLQELVAPREVVFLDMDWHFLGTKSGLANILSVVTGIDIEVLTHEKDLHEVSIADRMRWASGRETTRVEDRAYSLFGIFNINLPIIYGEGDRRAFLRLQKEMLQVIPDQSLFVWNPRDMPTMSFLPNAPLRFHMLRDADISGLLAGSPELFAERLDLRVGCRSYNPPEPQLRSFVTPLWDYTRFQCLSLFVTIKDAPRLCCSLVHSNATQFVPVLLHA